MTYKDYYNQLKLRGLIKEVTYETNGAKSLALEFNSDKFFDYAPRDSGGFISDELDSGKKDHTGRPIFNFNLTIAKTLEKIIKLGFLPNESNTYHLCCAVGMEEYENEYLPRLETETFENIYSERNFTLTSSLMPHRGVTSTSTGVQAAKNTVLVRQVHEAEGNEQAEQASPTP